MKSAQLKDMVKGWFVGAFDPTLAKTDQFEVAVKEYRAGEVEAKHYHKIATEITVIVRGKVTMCGREWSDGDMIYLDPGEATDFIAHTDVITVVVKFPSVANDKFVV